MRWHPVSETSKQDSFKLKRSENEQTPDAESQSRLHEILLSAKRSLSKYTSVRKGVWSTTLAVVNFTTAEMLDC